MPINNRDIKRKKAYKMKNYQLRAWQTTENGKVTGSIVLNHYDYGYVIKVHLFTIPGYVVNKCISDREKAIAFYLYFLEN